MSGILESAWGDYLRWSKASRDLKQRLGGAGRWAFGMALAGMVLETLSSQPGWFAWLGTEPATTGRVIGFLGALPLALSAFLSQRFLQPERRHALLLTRAISESLKREAFLFQAGAEPYDDPATREKRLFDRQSAILEPSGELLQHVTLAPLPDPLPARKQTPPALDPDTYVDLRLLGKDDGQITWYEKRATEHAASATTLQRTTLVLGALAVVLGVVNGSFELPAVGVWVSVVTAMGTAIAAHLTANRYDFLRVSYQATAARLRRQLDRWNIDRGKGADAARFSAFVTACETIMAEENQSWLAKGKEL